MLKWCDSMHANCYERLIYSLRIQIEWMIYTCTSGIDNEKRGLSNYMPSNFKNLEYTEGLVCTEGLLCTEY